MTQKIDYAAMRESIRKNYAEHPSNGDAVLAFEARNADLIADLCVTVVALENLIHEYSMRPDQVLAFVTEGLGNYLVREEDVIPDQIIIPRRKVGDA
jgi:hypothetical protein